MTHPTDKQAQDVVEGRRASRERAWTRSGSASTPTHALSETGRATVIHLVREIPFGDEPEALWHGG